jgi:hypothetical protein
MKYLTLRSTVNKTELSQQIFIPNLSQISGPSVQWEPSKYMQTDRYAEAKKRLL